MKNLVSRLLSAAFSGVIFISSLFGCSGLERKAGLFEHNKRNSLLEIASQRDGISEFGWEYQTMNLAYKEDKEGFWQPPLITLERGGGDCEDFAALSAFYSGSVYGNKIIILKGEDKEKKSKAHAMHLLNKNGKYGARAYRGENIYVEYSLSSLIKEIQRRSPDIKYNHCFILELDKMNKNWRTAKEDLNPYFLEMIKRRDMEVIFIKD